MKSYFVVAERWRHETTIGSFNSALRNAMDILKKSGRKTVSIYSIESFVVVYEGSVVPSGAGYRYTNAKDVSSSINKDGSLRAKPSPKSFLM